MCLVFFIVCSEKTQVGCLINPGRNINWSAQSAGPGGHESKSNDDMEEDKDND